MKVLNSLIIAGAILGTSSALAQEYPAQDYLVEHDLISAPVVQSAIVNRAPVEGLEGPQGYLVASGLVEAPTVAFEIRGEAPQFAIGEETRKLLRDWGFLAS